MACLIFNNSNETVTREYVVEVSLWRVPNHYASKNKKITKATELGSLSEELQATRVQFKQLCWEAQFINCVRHGRDCVPALFVWRLSAFFFLFAPHEFAQRNLSSSILRIWQCFTFWDGVWLCTDCIWFRVVFSSFVIFIFALLLCISLHSAFITAIPRRKKFH